MVSGTKKGFFMAVLANIAALIANITPLCVKLIDFIAKTYGDYKKGEQESQKLLLCEIRAKFFVNLLERLDKSIKF
jgi:hypothetical protein